MTVALERVTQVFREALNGVEIVEALPGKTACVWARAFDIKEDALLKGQTVTGVVLEATQKFAQRASKDIAGITTVTVAVRGQRLAEGMRYDFELRAPVML